MAAQQILKLTTVAKKQAHVIKSDASALDCKTDGGGEIIAGVGEEQRSEPRPKFIS